MTNKFAGGQKWKCINCVVEGSQLRKQIATTKNTETIISRPVLVVAQYSVINKGYMV